MAKIIALTNQKGGVGKTTSSVNIAASLAVSEFKTLIIDFNFQHVFTLCQQFTIWLNTAKFCKKIGADEAINYKKTDFEKKIKNITQRKGVDVILDSIGGNYVEKNIKILSKNGFLINIGWQKGSSVSINMMPIMLKRLTITGSTLRIRSVSFKTKVAKALLKNVWPYFEKKIIRPIIFETIPIKDAKKAHKLMESSKHIGKIVLELWRYFFINWNML